MPLPELTPEALRKALNEVGVGPGDGLLAHSALHLLGRSQGGLQMVLDTLLALIGLEGTLAVPAFNFGFANGEAYDPYATPSQGMGAFSEFVRQQHGALRSAHPMQSVALLGRHARELAAPDTCSAFDQGSAFERMLQLDFKLLLLGTDIQAASIVHYSEQRVAVPYRHWKDFHGKVHLGGQWQPKQYKMFVRDRQIDAQLHLAPLQRALEAAGQWHSTALNFGQVTACRLVDFIAAADALLAADPWAFVTNRPAPEAA
ncbi:MAG: AAC(3) family N-acetyltransferase [Anaerolineales bacterium]|nr:AAC(3) family N-acetyltransferase [Anaerolineales bacterium]